MNNPVEVEVFVQHHFPTGVDATRAEILLMLLGRADTPDPVAQKNLDTWARWQTQTGWGNTNPSVVSCRADELRRICEHALTGAPA